MSDELATAQKRIADLEAYIDRSITSKRLRDEFAMAAMPSILNEDTEFKVVAWIAYQIADAFMSEREKKR
jgi:hypothetical protein